MLKMSSPTLTTPQPSKKIRLLCLHGLRTSGEILKQQLSLANWQTDLGDLIEFEFLTAPHPASGKIPADVSGPFPGPYFEWWNSNEINGEMIYEGIEQSLDYLEQYLLDNGPFDGFLGFSMGAAVASLILILKKNNLRFQQFNFQLCVCIAAGIRVRDKNYGDMFVEDDVLEVPSIHVIGDKDQYRKYSISLSELFKNRIVLEHQRGHVVPVLKGEQLEEMRNFLIQNSAVQQNGVCRL